MNAQQMGATLLDAARGARLQFEPEPQPCPYPAPQD